MAKARTRKKPAPTPVEAQPAALAPTHDAQQPSGLRVIYSPRAPSGVRVDEDTALTFAAVWGCIRCISEDVAALPLGVYRKRPGGGRDRQEQHPADWLFSVQANPETTAFALRETLLAHSLAWGNGYAEIERTAGGQPVWLWQLTPDRVYPDRDSRGRLYYDIDNGSGPNTALDPQDVYHVKGLGFDGIVGYSVIRMLARTIGGALTAEAMASNLWGNDSTPGGVLTYPGKLQPGAQENIRAGFERVHSGPRGYRRVAILEEGMKWEATGLPPEDAQLLQTRQFSVTEIARIFRVPPHKIADLTRATFSNIEEQEIGYAVDTLMPWAYRVETEGNVKLFGRNQQGTFFLKHNFNARLRGNAAQRASFYKSMFDVGAFSTNDVLELEDRNPVEDGEQRFVPANMMPLAGASDPPPAPEPPPAPAQEVPRPGGLAAKRGKGLEWNEEDHPRDESGRFGEGGGSSDGGGKDSGGHADHADHEQEKQDRRDEEDSHRDDARSAEDDRTSEARDKEDEHAQAAREAHDEAVNAQREKEDQGQAARDEAVNAVREKEDREARLRDEAKDEQRDKEDKTTRGERDREDKEFQAETDRIDAGREKEDAGVREKEDKEDAAVEARDAEKESRREAEDKEAAARWEKEDEEAGRAQAEREAKREEEDRAVTSAREKEDAARDASREKEDQGVEDRHDRGEITDRERLAEHAANTAARDREDEKTQGARDREDEKAQAKREKEDDHAADAGAARDKAREKEDAAREKERAKEDAGHEKEDRATVATRNKEYDARQAEREKVDTAREKEEAKREAQREKEDAQRDTAREKEDAKHDKEDAAREAKRDKEDAANAAVDAKREAAREKDDAATNKQREREDKEVQAKREKEDAAREKARAAEDREIERKRAAEDKAPRPGLSRRPAPDAALALRPVLEEACARVLRRIGKEARDAAHAPDFAARLDALLAAHRPYAAAALAPACEVLAGVEGGRPAAEVVASEHAQAVRGRLLQMHADGTLAGGLEWTAGAAREWAGRVAAAALAAGKLCGRSDHDQQVAQGGTARRGQGRRGAGR